MSDEQRVQALEKELQKVRAEKELLERQITFSKGWVAKLKKRLERKREASCGGQGKAGEGANPLAAELEFETRALYSLESEHAEICKRIRFLEQKVNKERSKVFDFGWRKVDTTELKGAVRRLSGSELQALEVIAEAGGESVIQVVSRKMKIEYDYARLLCISLGRAHYIDITSSGQCRITEKGEEELEKRGMDTTGLAQREPERKWQAKAWDY